MKYLVNAFAYLLLYPLIHLLSILPFPILYTLSYILYFIIYKIWGYRKEIVWNNLTKSFPEKSANEIKKIMENYYLFLCDLIVETLKTMHMDKSEICKRCVFTPESIKLFKKFYEEKKSILIIMGHYGNWEWAGLATSLTIDQKLLVIYHPLSNPLFDKLLYSIRSKFGATPVPMQNTLKEILRNQNQITTTVFIADQAPNPTNAYWINFLNQDTPFYTGPEKIAKKFDYPIIYANVIKKKRGFYKIELQIISASPKIEPECTITENFTKLLEKQIKTLPETWLWSHNRWKHKRS